MGDRSAFYDDLFPLNIRKFPLSTVIEIYKVTLGYVDIGRSYQLRREELRSAYFFQCRCDRCTSEASMNQDYGYEAGLRYDLTILFSITTLLLLFIFE